MLKLTIYQWLYASFSLHVRYEVLIYTHRCVKIRIVMKTYNHWIECPRKLNVHPPCIMIVLTYLYDFLECNRYNHGYTWCCWQGIHIFFFSYITIVIQYELELILGIPWFALYCYCKSCRIWMMILRNEVWIEDVRIYHTCCCCRIIVCNEGNYRTHLT